MKTFKIYGRWGELVYDNANGVNGWDGKYNGTDAPPEVYAYYIELLVDECQVFSKKGNVTLVR